MVQLDAHTDEVAFMVQAVKPNGTLRFTTLGGWVPSNIPAHRVWVQTAAGDYIPGVTASKPPHFMSEASARPSRRRGHEHRHRRLLPGGGTAGTSACAWPPRWCPT